ncbi:putative F-box protein [Cardamine amara subsp. amara]|uniref:F-box protein n=1 Tax=Cardamine amara subsp. amara TaxID=228776 RepID=A0ABD1AIB5_CARAN
MSKFLPEELDVEILVRLSTKDLARFKCVCKTWRGLINHRRFAQRYQYISPLEFPLDQSMIDESTCVLHCDGPLKNHTLMVWNPSSKHFKIVPNPGIYQDSSILGFGYDPVYDDYKVVTFIDRLDSSTAHVFDFRTDSWRESVRIPIPDWHYRERRGTFLDQCLYWITMSHAV